MSKEQNKDHADLILRDFLAVERTHLANQRTLLSMVRTGLYFVVMGLSVISLESLVELRKYSIFLFIVAFVVILMGIIGYYKTKKEIVKLYTKSRS